MRHVDPTPSSDLYVIRPSQLLGLFAATGAAAAAGKRRCLVDDDGCGRERDDYRNNTVFCKTFSGRQPRQVIQRLPDASVDPRGFYRNRRRANFETCNNTVIYSNNVITKLLKYYIELYNKAYRFLNTTFST
jgi:hypothetical protein